MEITKSALDKSKDEVRKDKRIIALDNPVPFGVSTTGNRQSQSVVTL